MPPGFLGVGSCFGGGFLGCGLITGGGSFGGGFLSPSFCADTANVMPKTNEHVNKIFCKTFIAFTSSPVYLMLPGKTRSRAAYYQGNLSATDALMTFQAGIWLEMILSSSPVFYKT